MFQQEGSRSQGSSSFCNIFIYLRIYLFLVLVALCLCCCEQAFSSCGEQGIFFIAVLKLPLVVASLVVHGLSCPTACGIFLAQGSNPCPLHWQADSYPVRHQGSLPTLFLRTGSRSPGLSLLLNSMGQGSHRASPES